MIGDSSFIGKVKLYAADFDVVAGLEFYPAFDRGAVVAGFATFFRNQIITVALTNDFSGDLRREPAAGLEVAIRGFADAEAGF